MTRGVHIRDDEVKFGRYDRKVSALWEFPPYRLPGSFVETIRDLLSSVAHSTRLFEGARRLRRSRLEGRDEEVKLGRYDRKVSALWEFSPYRLPGSFVETIRDLLSSVAHSIRLFQGARRLRRSRLEGRDDEVKFGRDDEVKLGWDDEVK